MLANSFLKAEQLGITEAEVAALVKVLVMLDTGQIEEMEFHMGHIFHKYGTPSCMLGWAYTVSNGNAFPDASPTSTRIISNRLPYALVDLFLLLSPTGSNETITPGQAAIALRNYLTTGEARWKEACAG